MNSITGKNKPSRREMNMIDFGIFNINLKLFKVEQIIENENGRRYQETIGYFIADSAAKVLVFVKEQYGTEAVSKYSWDSFDYTVEELDVKVL